MVSDDWLIASGTIGTNGHQALAPVQVPVPKGWVIGKRKFVHGWTWLFQLSSHMFQTLLSASPSQKNRSSYVSLLPRMPYLMLSTAEMGSRPTTDCLIERQTGCTGTKKWYQLFQRGLLISGTWLPIWYMWIMKWFILQVIFDLPPAPAPVYSYEEKFNH